MEAAKIDWKNIESVFVVDQLFENINAPQWVDFLASSSSSSHDDDSPLHDDVAWFCRPDCKHPTSAEDFLKSSPLSSKLFRSVSVSNLIALPHWSRSREATTNLKRRGPANPNQFPNVAPNVDDSENQDPNFSTPPPHPNNKAGIKSSAEKDDYSDVMLESEEKPRLKATLSAKDLFGGKDFFGKITDFCNELKKMTATTKVKETMDEKVEEDQSLSHKFNSSSPYKPSAPVLDPKDRDGGIRTEVLGSRLEKKINEKDKERKPFLEVKLDAAGERNNGKTKLRKNNMREDDAENIPISLDLNNVKREAKISPIRVNPPTPQGFSATRDPVKPTPSKGSKSRLMGREIFQEMGQNKTLREELDEESGNAPLVAAKEGRTLDVFWFLKPCTLS